MATVSSLVYNICNLCVNYVSSSVCLCSPRHCHSVRQCSVDVSKKCSPKYISDLHSISCTKIFVFIALLSVLFVDFGDAHGIQLANDHTSHEFSSFTLIRPRVIHGRHRKSISTTLQEDGLHATHITLSFKKSNGESVVVDLQLNDGLLPHGHFLHSQEPGGGERVQNFTRPEDIDHCHYIGKIRGKVNSRAAISTCEGVKGVIFDGEATFFVESSSDQLDSEHFLYSMSDLNEEKVGKCGYEGTAESQNITNELKHSEFNRILRYKRAVDDSESIRSPYNANRDSSFVELLLVVDNKVYNALGQSLKKVHNHCKTIANIINALYMPLNIFIALIGVVVWTEQNEVDLSSDGDKTLKNFLHYRKRVLVQKYPNDNAQLLTREQFEGGVVGKALKGPICTYEYSGGVSMDHSSIIGVVATTVAHEMGHNFGMEHDSADCKCQDERCIMSASSSSIAPRHWSSCSIDQLNLAFHHGMNHCLKNKPTKLFDSPQCGNGFVEKGEQCDCGLPEYCDNSCCDPYTCMLHANASCATGECCDLDTCRPRTAGTVCRTADGECDLPEFCTGESEYCPNNVFKRDTEECRGGKAFCYQGSCRSRADQCKVLWGPSGNSSDECYTKNIDGTRHGNCGFDRFSNQYVNCDRDDIYCGMLHCRHLNERLEFGMESVSVLSHSFLNHENRIVVCRTAIVDLGLESLDPGLAPDGSKCGDEKMCVKQKCRSIEALRLEGTGVACPEDCNGNGVCNSLGHCHCEKGFAPPSCDNPGPGGSIDSGPASNPNAGVGFTTAMYIFFLGIVPFCAIVSFLVYYFRQNRTMIKRTPQVPKQLVKQSPSKSLSPSSGGQPKSTPSSPDDMNSALLRTSRQEHESSLLNNNMFGKFKGFTLKPLPNAASTNFGAPNVAFVTPVTKQVEEEGSGVPNRVAPPVPKVPNNVVLVTRSQTQVKNPVKSPTVTRTVSVDRPPAVTAPALPPPNPGTTAKPLISSPILEASTCTAKELMSPLKNSSGSGKFPVRTAPTTPIPSDATDTGYDAPLPREPKVGTLKRITSFLKKDEKPPVEKKIHRVIDRERLKTIEISAPIPLPETQTAADKVGLNRTQSMRSPTRKAPQPQFGSMRQASPLKRPPSIVGNRPKSPPPPRPPAPPGIGQALNGYQNPPPPKKVSSPEYADCQDGEAPLAHISEESTPMTPPDNIYSVIEEPPTPPKIPSPPKVGTVSHSVESMGLLGEIVNEIENRNLDSIYSVSTLRKKKSPDDDQTYANTSQTQESEDEYMMNMKSNASTTSSGYLRPTSINTPIARIAPTKPPEIPAPFSSFKSLPVTVAQPTTSLASCSVVDTVNSTKVSSVSEKTKIETKPPAKYQPYHTTLNRPGPYASAYRAGAKKDEKDIRPSALKTRTPSPKTNPDVVPSNPPPPVRNRPPDVVTNGPTKPQTPQKPNNLGKLRQNSITTPADGKKLPPVKWQNAKEGSKSARSPESQPNGQLPIMSSSKSRILTAASRPTAGKASSVATLQQKFESGKK